jgi:ABC-type glycerol-3-phosphate transport system permease component
MTTQSEQAQPQTFAIHPTNRGVINGKLRAQLLVKLPVFLLLCLVALTTLYPLLFMAITAFKSRTEYLINPYGLPQELYLSNFGIMVENYGLLTSFGNSVVIVSISVALSLLFASLTAYAIAKLRFRGKQALFFFMISLQLIPGPVLLIPIYLMFSQFGLINNPLSVILMYTVTSLPFGAFFLSASFRGIPDELMEAAKIDGASLWDVFLNIIWPMGRPSVLTLAILNFLTMWNELILALMLLPDEQKRTLTASVAMVRGRFVTNQPLLMTGLLVITLPTIIVLIIFSQYLVKGISAGVSK